MANKYLIKIAEKSNSYIGEAAAGAIGAGTIHGQFHEGNLTGRTTYYHGSTADVAKKIKNVGIVPGGSKGIIDSLGNSHFKNANKDLAFATKSKHQAFGYANQADVISKGEFNPYNRTGTAKKAARDYLKSFSPLHKDPRISTVNIPTWKDSVKKNITDNPELKANPFMSDAHKKALGKDTLTHKGTISTKYIKGAKGYQKNSLKEIVQFAKSNKGRFAKGVGVSGLAATALGLAGHSVYNKIKGNSNGK